jgi:hypothetical protein
VSNFVASKVLIGAVKKNKSSENKARRSKEGKVTVRTKKEVTVNKK